MATADTATEPLVEPLAAVRTRVADYADLTKPKIAAMALVTVAAGYLLGADPANLRLDLLLHTLVGAGVVAAGGSALNHWLERKADANMHRTLNRPLPTGRLLPGEAFAFGIALTVGGVVYLLAAIPTPAAALAALATAFLYVAVYTPMKRVTSWNTVVGAIPGALPPVIGWAAARGDVGVEGWALFAILFVWQLPHFFSIAWMHRDDYARGGMVMLPVVDHRDGRLTGRATVATCLLLIPATAAPFWAGSAGWVYLAASLPLAIWFLARCIRFAKRPTSTTARTVLRGSLVYLAGVMALLVLDGVLPRYL